MIDTLHKEINRLHDRSIEIYVRGGRAWEEINSIRLGVAVVNTPAEKARWEEVALEGLDGWLFTRQPWQKCKYLLEK